MVILGKFKSSTGSVGFIEIVLFERFCGGKFDSLKLKILVGV